MLREGGRNEGREGGKKEEEGRGRREGRKEEKKVGSSCEGKRKGGKRKQKEGLEQSLIHTIFCVEVGWSGCEAEDGVKWEGKKAIACEAGGNDGEGEVARAVVREIGCDAGNEAKWEGVEYAARVVVRGICCDVWVEWEGVRAAM